ncbi:Ras-related protein Rab-18-B, partial [Lonchura striata]
MDGAFEPRLTPTVGEPGVRPGLGAFLLGAFLLGSFLLGAFLLGAFLLGSFLLGSFLLRLFLGPGAGILQMRRCRAGIRSGGSECPLLQFLEGSGECKASEAVACERRPPARSSSRAGPAQPDPLHTVDGDKVPVVHMKAPFLLFSVYDVTRKDTFTGIGGWLNELEMYTSSSSTVKMLVGNKTDKPDREVERKEGLQLARKHSLLFIETSAKTEDGVQHAFEELVIKILQTPDLWDKGTAKKGVQLMESSAQQHK